MRADMYGLSGFALDLTVSLNEMKDWEAERIAEFFNGLAQINAAANPNNWDDFESSQQVRD